VIERPASCRSWVPSEAEEIELSSNNRCSFQETAGSGRLGRRTRARRVVRGCALSGGLTTVRSQSSSLMDTVSIMELRRVVTVVRGG
jgi:hypothetical protein